MTGPFKSSEHEPPFTTTCPAVRTHWHGKKTMSVYDGSGRKVCSVPAVYPYRSREKAALLAQEIAELFNKEAQWLQQSR